MRIAIIDPSLFTLPYDRALAGALMGCGHDVTLYGRAVRSGDGSPGSITISEVFYRFSERALARRLPSAARLTLKGFDHAWSMWRLLGHLKRNPPDIIHFQWLPLPMLDDAFLRAFRRVAPIVLTVHDTNPFNGEASASIQRLRMRNCLQHFDQIIVHTMQGQDRLYAQGLRQGQVSVVPHGLLTAHGDHTHDRFEGEMTFLLFGKLRPYKGADLLIKAFLGLPLELRMKARLRIVGKPYMDVAPLRALALPAEGRITIETGFVEDDAIAEAFGPGTVAVFPYREIEASGVLSLALAQGRPIIASRLGSFKEVLTDGKHGVLVPVGDVEALTDALQKFLNDRNFAAAAAVAVRDVAKDVPSWHVIAGKTVSTYDAALNAASSAKTMEALAAASGL